MPQSSSAPSKSKATKVAKSASKAIDSNAMPKKKASTSKAGGSKSAEPRTCETDPVCLFLFFVPLHNVHILHSTRPFGQRSVSPLYRKSLHRRWLNKDVGWVVLNIYICSRTLNPTPPFPVLHLMNLQKLIPPL